MEKSFGITFSVVFALLAIYPIFSGASVNLYMLCIAIFFLTVTITAPKYLFIASKIWLNFGKRISYFTSPVIMILTYIISVVPMGLAMRALRIDLLDLKFNSNKKTYWINSEDFDDTLENQF
tara:strand:- start:990 stop:1355 length:366 start_codon:yes stop_codon:yes gene_type:complete